MKRVAEFVLIYSLFVLLTLWILSLTAPLSAAEMWLSQPDHEWGRTTLSLHIELEPGESYDLFRFHISGGNILCHTVKPGPVELLSWKMNGWGYRSSNTACGRYDGWSSLERRIYANFGLRDKIEVEVSGKVIHFDFVIEKGAKPTLIYGRTELNGVETLARLRKSGEGGITTTPSNWSNIKELWR